MKWIVLWKPAAETNLTEIWLSANDKAEITGAANRIDSQLRRDPFAIGESRDQDRRVHFDFPLGILYTVDIKTHSVFVTRVWRIASPSKNA